MTRKYDHYTFSDLVSNAWEVNGQAITSINGHLYIITAINLAAKRAALRPADDSQAAYEDAAGIYTPNLYLLPLA